MSPAIKLVSEKEMEDRMEKLKRLIEEICTIRGIKPGDIQADNSDFGELGQLLENLCFNEPGAWSEVEANLKLRERVTETAEYYLKCLKKDSKA